MKKQLSNPKVMLPVAVALAALAGAAGWFLLVSPQNTKAADLEQEVASVESQIALRRAQLAQPTPKVRVRASDVFKLRRAMPDDTNMAGIMLELNQVAGRSQVALRAVTPQQQTITGGVGFQPVEVVLVGRFGNVTKFLRDVKRLVDVRREKLAATGRLFSVESVQLKEAQKTGFPDVEATVRVQAYVFRGGAAPGPADAGTTAPADGGEELNTAAGVNP